METAINKLLHVLLIEDNDDHAELIERLVADQPISLKRVDRLAGGIELLAQGGVDAVLLDLSLPDSSIEETLARLQSISPEVPIVVLTTLEDVDFAARTVQQGAQDFLVKSKLSGYSLVRALRYAIERMRARAELERYASQLERSNEQLSQFAHTIAHEVRSPLAVVVYCCELLKRRYDDVFDDETSNFVQSTQEAAQGLGQLVGQLLEFARAGSLDHELKLVNSKEVCSEALQGLREAIRESRATVTFDSLPEVHADAIQLKHLFQNLISNAVKYRGSDLPRVHVRAEQAGDVWKFAVEDNGIGIAPEDAERIFALFQRLHDSNEIPGTGIGLAFSKRIVETHGGKIWVESQPGQGTTFYFTLPTTARPSETVSLQGFLSKEVESQSH